MQDDNTQQTQEKDKNEKPQKKDNINVDLMRPPLSTKVLKSSKSSMDSRCCVCNVTFNNHWHLKYHIRQNHFNLRAKVPYCELKDINQVWFEKVINTDTIVEIKKTGTNRLLMRKLKSNTNVKINETNSEEIDLTHLYPIKSQVKE